MRKVKLIRDPIHGYITIHEEDLPIVDSKLLQRLRKVRQNGFSSYVYPGMTHNRFEHTLGVYHLGSTVLDYIEINLHKYLGDEELADKLSEHKGEFTKLLKLASLLHDSGHLPFSHSFELIFDMDMGHENYKRRGITHEKYSFVLAKKYKDIITHDVYSENDLEQAINVLNGEVKGEWRILSYLLSSQMDIDRMDYLLRDALYAGVKYGIYDLPRLLISLIIFEEDGKFRVGIYKKALKAAEQFVIARYSMWHQIYVHKVTNSYDTMFIELLKLLIDSELIELKDPSEIEKGKKFVVLNKEYEFEYFDDIVIENLISKLSMGRDFVDRDILSEMKQKLTDDQINKLFELASMIRWRRHYKVLMTTDCPGLLRPIARGGISIPRWKVLADVFRKKFQTIQEKVREYTKKYKGKLDIMIFLHPVKWYSGLNRPIVIHVGGKSYRNLEDVSDIVGTLNRESKMDIVRIYYNAADSSISRLEVINGLIKEVELQKLIREESRYGTIHMEDVDNIIKNLVECG